MLTTNLILKATGNNISWNYQEILKLSKGNESRVSPPLDLVAVNYGSFNATDSRKGRHQRELNYSPSISFAMQLISPRL